MMLRGVNVKAIKSDTILTDYDNLLILIIQYELTPNDICNFVHIAWTTCK